MKTLLLTGILLIGALASANNTIIGRIASYNCAPTCKLTIFGTIDEGASTSTSITTLDASRYSVQDIVGFMDQGVLAITTDDRIQSVVAATPYAGKIPCGHWNEWTNCPAGK